MTRADRAAVHRFRPASPTTALVLGVVFALVALALVPLSLLARQSPQVNGGEALGAVPFGVVGFVLARRLPRNPIGWIFLAIATCLLLSVDSGFYAVISYPLGYHLPLAPAALFLYQLWGPALSLFALVVLLFPDGTLPSRASRVIMCLFLAVLVGFTVALGVAVSGAVPAMTCSSTLSTGWWSSTVRPAGSRGPRRCSPRSACRCWRWGWPARSWPGGGPPVSAASSSSGWPAACWWPW